MKLYKKLHYHPKKVKPNKNIKEKLEKKPHGSFHGKKWFPDH